MNNEKESFLKRKNVIISFKRYGIDAMGSMALGLFASLLIGTIINTIGQNVCPGSFVSEKLLEIGGYATSVTGAAMALAIGHALQAPPLVMYSLCAVGAACNAIGGSGGPLAVFFVAVITCEIGKLVSKETKIDIIVTPAVTVIVGVVLAMLLAPVCKNICDALGAFIGWATDLRPFWMGMIISVVVGIVLTLPISSAAICAAVGISGGAVLAGLADGSVTMEVWNGLALAGGAATAGCCAHMLGFAILSFPDNGVGGYGLKVRAVQRDGAGGGTQQPGDGMQQRAALRRKCPGAWSPAPAFLLFQTWRLASSAPDLLAQWQTNQKIRDTPCVSRIFWLVFILPRTAASARHRGTYPPATAAPASAAPAPPSPSRRSTPPHRRPAAPPSRKAPSRRWPVGRRR